MIDDGSNVLNALDLHQKVVLCTGSEIYSTIKALDPGDVVMPRY